MNIALYIVCNNKAVLMANVLLYSFKKHNPWFDGDVVVLHDDGHCILSESAKDTMRMYHEDIIFKKAVSEDYDTLFNRICSTLGDSSRYRTLPCIYKWDMFRDSKYDRIIYMDTDILPLNSMKASMDYCDHHNFLAAADSVDWSMSKYKGHYPAGSAVGTRGGEFNGGLYVVGGEYISDDFFSELLRYAELTDFRKFYKKLGKGRIGEQAFLSNFMREHSYYILSSGYNRIRRVIPDSLILRKPNLLQTIKNVHYTSKKPINPDSDRIRLNGVWRSYKEINDVWRDAYVEAGNSLDL